MTVAELILKGCGGTPLKAKRPTPGICAFCGKQADGLPLASLLGQNFSDGYRLIQGARIACLTCAAVYQMHRSGSGGLRAGAEIARVFPSAPHLGSYAVTDGVDLQRVLTSPPDPPFVIIVNASGGQAWRKHIWLHARVALSRDVYPVTLVHRVGTAGRITSIENFVISTEEIRKVLDLAEDGGNSFNNPLYTAVLRLVRRPIRQREVRP
jgi:hypothetical protein